MLVTEKFSGASNLEIVGGKGETGTEILQRFDRLQPFLRIRGQVRLRRYQ